LAAVAAVTVETAKKRKRDLRSIVKRWLIMKNKKKK
jgi:hypothetical protein